jgi:hypothetical protein
MAKYQVRIEDNEFEQTFTLDELLDHGLLDDYDPKIQVRAEGENKWIVARKYPYDKKEKENFSGFTINPDGSVTRHTTPSQSSTTSITPSSTSADSSKSENSGCDVWIWIAVIVLGSLMAIIV